MIRWIYQFYFFINITFFFNNTALMTLAYYASLSHSTALLLLLCFVFLYRLNCRLLLKASTNYFSWLSLYHLGWDASERAVDLSWDTTKRGLDLSWAAYKRVVWQFCVVLLFECRGLSLDWIERLLTQDGLALSDRWLSWDGWFELYDFLFVCVFGDWE